MPVLHVKDVPNDLYEAISIEACRYHRTIDQQTIMLLQKQLGETVSGKDRRRQIFEQIQSIPISRELTEMDTAAMVRDIREERTNQILHACGWTDIPYPYEGGEA